MNAYQRAVKEITDERRADLDAGLAVWREALHTNKELREAYKIYQDEAVKKAQKQQNSIEFARKNLKTPVFVGKIGSQCHPNRPAVASCVTIRE